MMTDPVADLLTRIRNANRIERAVVDIPASRLKRDIAQVLKDEGYITDFQVGEMVANAETGQKEFQPAEDWSKPKLLLRVALKYGPEGEKVLQHIERISRPGCRVYRKATGLKPVLDGLGISIISTNRGVMSDRRARTQRLGGELIARVW